MTAYTKVPGNARVRISDYGRSMGICSSKRTPPERTGSIVGETETCWVVLWDGVKTKHFYAKRYCDLVAPEPPDVDSLTGCGDDQTFGDIPADVLRDAADALSKRNER